VITAQVATSVCAETVAVPYYLYVIACGCGTDTSQHTGLFTARPSSRLYCHLVSQVVCDYLSITSI